MRAAKRKPGRRSNADRIAATAYQPDIRDGASTRHAIRTRIALIASERGLSKAAIAKVMTLKHYEIMLFAKRHSISLDWLICGDLRGLLKTAQGCPDRPPQRLAPEQAS